MFKTIVSISVLVCMVGILSGCQTSYKRMGFSGGYTDQRISSDTVLITVGGNAFTSGDTIETMGIRRAAEVTVQNGFDYFYIETGRNQMERETYELTNPSASTNCTGFGRTLNCRTSFSNPTSITARKHQTKLRIRMFRGNAPKRPGYYVAKEVLKYTTNVTGSSVIDKTSKPIYNRYNSGAPIQTRQIKKPTNSQKESPARATLSDRLKTLKELHKLGIINDREYARKKKDLLQSL